MRLKPSSLAPALLAALLGAPFATQSAEPAEHRMTDADARHLWLEEVEGERALAWVREQNARSLAELQADPRFARFETEARRVLESQERIADPVLIGGAVYNFWQDARHVRGLLRRADWASYAAGAPQWETVLDVDALARDEDRNWVTGMPHCLPPTYRRCLVSLSNGGKDASTVREFDLAAKRFVADGFVLPEAKSGVEWRDEDTLVVATDWGADTLTESGYPYVVKLWQRGTPLARSVELFRGERRDVGVFPAAFHDPESKAPVVAVIRAITFFESSVHVLDGERLVALPLPPRATVQGVWHGDLVASLEQDWTVDGRTHRSGAVVSFPLAEFLRSGRAQVRVVYEPGPRAAFQAFRGAKSVAYVVASENVVTRAWRYALRDGRWVRLGPVALPERAQVNAGNVAFDDDRAFFYAEGFLTPRSLWVADADGAARRLDDMPTWFDASRHTVEQFEATSKDGTKVPYFVVRPRDRPLDGAAPTLLYAYGGFQVSMTPSYSGTLGKLWLEDGGTYVLANVRGGGEFGPAWHQAGLKTRRQVVYDDFVAVAEDLIARRVTSPRRLGIMGGSNGGLLMGVMLTQRPDLWNALVVQVPLLDMLRYHLLLAGASWVDEYGSPDVPAERAFLEQLSPYHRLRAGTQYPPPFFVTSTKDDRVHPAHARKMAKRMQEMDLPFYYYENVDGGHAAAANQRERAKRVALEFTYLSRRLKD